MKKQPFGATVLSAIQLNLAVGEDVSPIVQLIDQILSNLYDAQATADSRNSQNKARCETNIQQFIHQIEVTKNNISNLEGSIALNEENLSRDSKALSQANRDCESNINNIGRGNDEREEAHKKWIQSEAEFDDALTGIDEATRLIQHMIHGVSFIQVKSRFDKVIEKLSTNKSKHSTLFKPLVVALFQLSNQLNNQSVQKILNLLISLRQALIDAQNEGRSAEETAANLWAKFLQQLLNNKQRYTDEKSRLNDSIGSLKELLDQQRVSLENNKNSLENFLIQLSDEQTLCDKQAQEYLEQSKENEKETAILVELNEHLNDKFPQVVEFIQ